MISPSLSRLTAVELRKTIDTRAGFWLARAVAATTIALVVVVGLVGDAEDHTLRALLEVAIQPASILLPVVGVLLVSSEWSQRTALITFALVPQRSRVLAAKVTASALLSLGALVLCLAVAAIATAVLAPGVAGAWSLPAVLIVQVVVLLVTGMVGGVAFGAALPASAPAIVALFVAPTAAAALFSIPALEGAGRWLDAARALAPMAGRVMAATEWAHVATALTLWMVVPLLVGLRRIIASEPA